ncbi:MAG: hypothetical protein ACQESC_00430 [Nanobdellota archaeon]
MTIDLIYQVKKFVSPNDTYKKNVVSPNQNSPGVNNYSLGLHTINGRIRYPNTISRVNDTYNQK